MPPLRWNLLILSAMLIAIVFGLLYQGAQANADFWKVIFLIVGFIGGTMTKLSEKD